MAVHVSHASLPYPIRNARFSFLVPGLDADGDPTDPTTPDSELSLDNGTWADATEEVSTPSGSNGLSLMTLTGAETNNSAIGYVCKVASGPKPTLMTFYPRNLAVVGSGTLSAGSAGGGTLGTLLPYDVTGCFIRTTGGTGGGGTGGANNQARRIITYNTSTGAFTVTPNWETQPDNTTTYDILLPEGVTLGMLRALNPTTAGRTLDVSAGGEAGVDWANVGTPGSTVNLSATTVKTLTDAPADSAGVTTLLSRIPSGLFTGITSLAQWLGLIAGKQTGNSTARTELRATGAGSGTYDETTDSLEALKDDAASLGDVADAVLDEVVLGSYTLRQLVRGISAANLGKLSGAATTTITIRSVDDTKDVVVATVDASGNRSSFTLDLT